MIRILRNSYKFHGMTTLTHSHVGVLVSLRTAMEFGKRSNTAETQPLDGVGDGAGKCGPGGVCNGSAWEGENQPTPLRGVS